MLHSDSIGIIRILLCFLSTFAVALSMPNIDPNKTGFNAPYNNSCFPGFGISDLARLVQDNNRYALWIVLLLQSGRCLRCMPRMIFFDIPPTSTVKTETKFCTKFNRCFVFHSNNRPKP